MLYILYVRLYICLLYLYYIQVYVFLCVCIYIYVCVWVYVDICTCMDVCMFLACNLRRIHVRYIHMCVFVNIFGCINSFDIRTLRHVVRFLFVSHVCC